MASVFNAFVAYQFLKTLTTKWDQMEAYKLGIIDANGKQLKKTAELETAKEKQAYTIFHRLVFNLKRILERFPFGKSRIASYSAAFALLKESKEDFSADEYEMMENLLIDYINLHEEKIDKIQNSEMLTEEIANAVGTGANVAGLTGVPAKFAGMPVFSVKTDTYAKLFKGKKKYARWYKYMESDEAKPIRDYIKKRPKEKIVLMDQSNGTMMILYRHNEI